MKEEDYEETQYQLLTLSRIIVDTLKLDGFIKTINKAEAVGPVIDPTLFKKGNPNMQRIKNIALAAQRFQNEVRPELAAIQPMMKED